MIPGYHGAMNPNAAASLPGVPPRLRVNRGAPLGSSQPVRRCPQCGDHVRDDEVLCVECRRTIQRRTPDRTRTALSVYVMLGLSIAASIIVAAAAIMILVSIRADRDPFTTATQAPPPPHDYGPPNIHAALETGADEASDRATPSAPTAEPATSETDRVDALQQRLRDSLDARWPMYDMGDTVALRRTDGLVHRGQLAGVRDGYTLLVDGNRRERVPLDALDAESRLRVDSDWRERRVAQRLHQLRHRE